LIALLLDSPMPLAGQAEELLCHVAGDQAPQVSLGTGASEERRQSREAWAGWWQRNEATLDLAKLDLQQRMLGLNLIVVCDTLNNGIGRVWEIRADAKPRWEINDANYPVDGEMLPRNRVLIAEQRTNRVTERNSQGKVLWEYQANTALVSCHRLANGNTFIATYNELMEITPDKKKIVSHVVSQATVYSAQKLRNGHYACYLSNGHLIELDEKGKQVRNFKVGTHKIGLVKFEVLPGGRFLVPNQEAGKILEMDGAGKVLWQCAAANVNSVQRLPNGNLLACSWQDRRVFELNRAGTIVWEHRVGGGPLRIQRR
ncbi:MAG TPA: hypothetical protein VKI65_14490, partial [Gemmataceae bacterium]|nr:hypothetical protein [Gemmataceae bacterium]